MGEIGRKPSSEIKKSFARSPSIISDKSDDSFDELNNFHLLTVSKLSKEQMGSYLSMKTSKINSPPE